MMSSAKLWAAGLAAVFIAGLFATIAYLNYQNDLLGARIDSLNIDIGQKNQAIAQYHQDIIGLEAENIRIAKEKANADATLASNRKAQQSLASRNSKLKNELGALKRENSNIKKQLNRAIDYSVIGLLRKQPNANYYYDENGICHATGSVNDGNACPVYTAESLVNYALDLEKAIESCNQDKKSIREWRENILQELSDKNSEV